MDEMRMGRPNQTTPVPAPLVPDRYGIISTTARARAAGLPDPVVVDAWPYWGDAGRRGSQGMQSTPTFGVAASGDRPGRYVDWDTEPGNLVGRNPNTGPWNPHPRYPASDTGAEQHPAPATTPKAGMPTPAV